MNNRPRSFGKKSKGPKDTWATLKRLLKLIFTGHPIPLIVAFISIIVAAISGVAGSLFLQRLVDDYILPLLKLRSHNFSALFGAILVMGGIYYLGVIATLIFTQIMPVLGQRIQRQIRDDLFSHMQTLPVNYFDRNSFGDIMSRYTNDVDTLMQLISQSLPQFISSLFNIVFVVVGMLSLSPLLTLVSLVIFGLSIGVVRFLSNRSSKYFQAQQKSLGALNGFIEESLNGLKVIKVFSHEPQTQQRFDAYNEGLREDAARANGFATMLFPIMGNIGNLLYVLVALVGGILAVNQISGLTLGAIAAFLQLSRNFSQPISQISQQLNAIIIALAGAERIFQLQDEPEETDQGQVVLVRAIKGADGILAAAPEGQIWAWKYPDPKQPLIELRGRVVFDHVNFSYDGQKQVLHDINLVVAPGQKVALVGSTGAGKTTITNMLTRFYEIDSGTITYDGINIQDIRKASLRQSLGMVLQETNLFTDTVANNIRFGNLTATDAQVHAAADLANATTFIDHLPQGFETQITNGGSSLSQGERQLLSIARAAVADPPVMILDEATSSIDTKTERLVQAGMDNLMRDRTTFAIAHRLSTIFNADLILVIEQGQIIERGNHESLMAKKGAYYELYTGKKALE
ncbi:ABC transporter ATP-binding protein [Lactobacillus sp. CC-MHH1034]|uniref:ABC transporter ATP-binding protein n=1 Tax=Agrilactobacillus fermenti TaxID=2586909 RepID=UPI001E4C2396|nr:ABC transporter ATP-binding protein [Agrilactobacillus fermenti]MCD2255131.1 ABC transporter ATP-binding protein [Agrilactobacillus fermenti]